MVKQAGKALKIGLVFDDSLDKPDGVQQYILSIGQWLTSQGHEVHYLVGHTKRTDIERVHSLSRNLNVTFNGNQLSIPLPVQRRGLRQLLDKEQFDVLHVQMPYSPWLAGRLIAAAPANTTIVGTFHIVAYSWLVQLATRGLALWTRRSLQRFSEVVSVSSAAVTYAKATYGLETTVLPCVFDYQRFTQATAILPLPAGGKIRILFLGRLVERKGCQYLLEAVRLLHNRGIANFEVVICGKGPLLEKLTDYVRQQQLPVTFAGFVSEAAKPGYYASADIAVFPSTGGESFGIVLIEAMASGRSAVLAAANSGYASVMAPQPQLLVSPASAITLADGLERLLTDPKVRQAAAAWGQTYSQQFDTAVVGLELLKLYRGSTST